MSVEPSIQSERDTLVAATRPKKPSESLATIGRVYGNNISKLNVLKPQQKRHQSARELREPWVSSSKTEAREYGDYYSWQARLSYLEAQRINITTSKGVEPFIDEYMKKLFRCQMFERGHNVEPFASGRLEVLNRSGNANNSNVDVVHDSKESFASNRYRRENFTSSVYRKNIKSSNALPVAALKTIEMIRKHKNGQPIADELEVTNRKRISVGNDRRLSGQQVITSSLQNQKISPKQNKSRSDMNVSNKRAGELKGNISGRATSQSSLVIPSVKQNKSKSIALADSVNSIDQRNNSENKPGAATIRTSSIQNQKVSLKRNKGRTSVTTGQRGSKSSTAIANEIVSTKQRRNSDAQSVISDNPNSNTSVRRKSKIGSTKNVNSSIENQTKRNKSDIADTSGQSSSKSSSTMNLTSTIRVETISREQNRDSDEMSVILDNANSTTNNSSSMQSQTILPKQNKGRISSILSNVLKKNKSTTKRSSLLQNDNQKQNENEEKMQGSVPVDDTAITNRSRGSKSSSIKNRTFILQNQEILTEENENVDESNGNSDTVSRSGHDDSESGVSTIVTSSVADSNLKVTEPEPDLPNVPVIYDIGQNFVRNLEEQNEVESEKSHFSTNRITLYQKNFLHPLLDKNASVESTESFDKDKYIESVIALSKTKK